MKIFILHINIVVNVFKRWISYLSPGSIALNILVYGQPHLFGNNNFCKLTVW